MFYTNFKILQDNRVGIYHLPGNISLPSPSIGRCPVLLLYCTRYSVTLLVLARVCIHRLPCSRLFSGHTWVQGLAYRSSESSTNNPGVYDDVHKMARLFLLFPLPGILFFFSLVSCILHFTVFFRFFRSLLHCTWYSFFSFSRWSFLRSTLFLFRFSFNYIFTFFLLFFYFFGPTFFFPIFFLWALFKTFVHVHFFNLILLLKSQKSTPSS